MHLGARLAENDTLQNLNLRLNRVEDNGVCHLLQDLCINQTLRKLNVSSNDLTHRCLAYVFWTIPCSCIAFSRAVLSRSGSRKFHRTFE